MPRLSTDSSLCYKTLKVNKIAFEELINRGYDMQELFNNLILSLLQIETDSEIRYSNAKTAIQNLKDEKEKLQLQRMHEEQKAAEYAQREKEKKFSKIIPALDWIVGYISDHKDKLQNTDESLLRFVSENITRKKDSFGLRQEDLEMINLNLIKIIRGYFAEYESVTSETLKKYLIAKL